MLQFCLSTLWTSIDYAGRTAGASRQEPGKRSRCLQETLLTHRILQHTQKAAQLSTFRQQISTALDSFCCDFGLNSVHTQVCLMYGWMDGLHRAQVKHKAVAVHG
jgi:hypothetical protein